MDIGATPIEGTIMIIVGTYPRDVAYKEVIKQKKRFGLLYSCYLESGFGMPELVTFNSYQEVKDKINDLMTNVPNGFGGVDSSKTPAFHGLEFHIIQSYHRDAGQ